MTLVPTPVTQCIEVDSLHDLHIKQQNYSGLGALFDLITETRCL